MTGTSANVVVATVLRNSTEAVAPVDPPSSLPPLSSPPSSSSSPSSTLPYPSFSYSASSSESSPHFSREVLNNLVDSIITCLQDKDVENVRQYLETTIQYTFEASTVNTIDEVLSFLSSYTSSFSSLQFFVKRKIIDEEQGIIAVEAVTRSIAASLSPSSSSSRPSSPSSSVLSSSPPSTGVLSSSPPSSTSSSPSSSTSPSKSSRPCSPSSIISERQIAWILQSSNNGKIKQWKAWQDQVWHGAVADMNTPLPSEVWHRSSSPSFESRSYIENLMIKNSKLYANNEMKKWAEECAHNEVIMHPPWDTLIGRDCCLKAAHIFHSEYRDTVITPLRLIYDSKQPGIVAYQQIFQTTNRESGKEGKDEDYVFVEVVDGKIRYWRTYFDTGKSSQTTAQTFKSKVICASLGKEAR